VVAAPDTVSAAALERLASALTVRAGATAQRDGILVVPAGAVLEEPAAVAYLFSRDSAGVAVAYGVVYASTDFGRLFEGWYAEGELLPNTMTQSVPNDSLLHVSVRGPGDTPFFESGVPYADALEGADTLREDHGSLIVRASVRPDAAARLIIGGLPTSRLPLILGLLLLTLGVGGAALFQIRRERQLARLRDDFISGVSHELRTPLAQIRMFAELQEAGKLRTPQERDRAIRVINRETQRLTHLVENILRYSQLRRTGERRSVREAVDLGEAVGEILEAFRPLAGSRSMNVETSIADGLAVLANRDVVKQMLVNLIDNAVKYGAPGQTIRIEGERSNGDARISVEDEGPGIPRQERARVWQPYRRLQREIESQLPGTGIGLAVVSQLAAASGGCAWVEDGRRGGARFTIELPAGAAVPAMREAAHEEVPA
jgi:signal transduction histidine kinase